MNTSTQKIAVGIGLIILAALSRLLPLPPNFAPVAAIAMFGALMLPGRSMAVLLPLAIMILSDLLLAVVKYDVGYAIHSTQIAVYLCFVAVVFIGRWAGTKGNYGMVALGTLAGSVLFFVVTNLAVWLFEPLYAQSFEGLVACYTAAIPFFRNSLLGDFCYLGAMVFVYELSKRVSLKTA